MARVIGMIGGMSPQSTSEYYDRLARAYRQRHDDQNYPPVILYSVPFQPYLELIGQGRWDAVAEGLGAVARTLQEAGAEFLVLSSVTLHRIIDEVQAYTTVPFLGLVDVTADAIVDRGMHIVALLGTRFTMEQPFFREELMQHGLRVLTPGDEDRAALHRILSEELPVGAVRPESRAAVAAMIERLRAEGAEGVILGGAEMPLLVRQEDSCLPLFETTALHVEAILDYALGEGRYAGLAR